MNAHTSVPLSAEAAKTKALRDGIDSMMDLCTEKQIAFLNKIHDNAPWKGLANCPDNKLVDTYELLRRTVAANVGA
jgi:hypothetical protein